MGATYHLECTDCPFRETICGDFSDAIDAVEAHREERSAGGSGHFVNLHRRE